MIHRVLLIGKWVVDFLFAKKSYDIDGVIACLREINADMETISEAKALMEDYGLNCGFTFANPDNRRALVVVGPTSSGDEFLNTFTHEIHHLAVAIADSIGYDLEGESPAYIAGDAAYSLASVVCALGCSHCRE